MKKVLVLAAALALAATPAAAQQSAAPVASAQAQSAVVTTTQAPSIFVSQDEIRQRVAAAEAEREGAQLGSSNWWYTVAAIALGVVIALLLID
jgi:curli biogenesis system outer membrane secretion channel CsgG